jgi:hypothetical protein
VRANSYVFDLSFTTSTGCGSYILTKIYTEVR